MRRGYLGLERAIPVRRRRRRLLWRVVLVLATVAVLGVMGISVYVGWNLSHLERRPVDRNPSEYGLAYESVEFTSTDGVTLRGWFMSADSSNTIVFVHGFRSNRLAPSLPALELARSFVENGFNVLMFDLRNSGESDGDVTTLGYHEVKDVYGAVTWLREERFAFAEQIGLIGFSMGATTSIMAAANEPAIKAVVADSPFSDLRTYLKSNMPFWTGLPNIPFTWTIMAVLPPLIGLDVEAVSPRAVMPHLEQPVLLIHSDGDEAIPVIESEILAEAGRPDRTSLWVVPSTMHVGARQADPVVYDARVIEFFRDAMGVPSNGTGAASTAETSF